MKTKHLAGCALDWAAGTALGRDMSKAVNFGAYLRIPAHTGSAYTVTFCPSTDWTVGGPIIEREGIRLHRSHTGEWWASPEVDPHRPISGATPLVAAMRCFVAEKMGDEIELPQELLQDLPQDRSTQPERPRG